MIDSTDQITITCDLKNSSEIYQINGSAGSELIKKLAQSHRIYKVKVDSLGELLLNSQDKKDFFQIKNHLDSIFSGYLAKYRNYVTNFIDSNINSLVCYWALSEQLGSKPVLRAEKDFKYYEKVDSSLSRNYPHSIYTDALSKYVATKKRKLLESKLTQERLNIGSVAPEIFLNDPHEKSISLQSLKGKYVLVDFWASWHLICRKQNIELKKIYDQFKGKEFEILGVSLDKTEIPWVGAIKQDKITWLQVFGNINIAEIYAIKDIPTLFLLDKEGKIIAKNIAIKELKEILKSKLTKST